MLFKYKAVDHDGKIVKKTAEGESEENVQSYLQGQGYFVVSIKQQANPLFAGFSSLLGRASQRDVVDFTRQLAIMMNAGLTIIQSLEILKKQTAKESMRDALLSIDKRIRSGS